MNFICIKTKSDLVEGSSHGCCHWSSVITVTILTEMQRKAFGGKLISTISNIIIRMINIMMVFIILTPGQNIEPFTTPGPSPTTSNATTTGTTSTTTGTTTPGKSGGSGQSFDGASFVGGIILSLGIVAIIFFGLKFYKARKDQNYHTL